MKKSIATKWVKALRSGNYKQTREDTEADAKVIKCVHKLRNAMRIVNGDWKPDWSDVKQCKYYLYYNTVNKQFLVDYSRPFACSFFYFKSEEAALQALSMLDDEDKEVLKGLV